MIPGLYSTIIIGTDYSVPGGLSAGISDTTAITHIQLRNIITYINSLFVITWYMQFT